jgi:adenylate cyclase
VTVVVSGLFVRRLVQQADDLAIAARVEAETAKAELALLNASLEDRVTHQVARIERLCRLRRFLPNRVADSLVHSDDESLLLPHRREIAVVFCDLRGFSAFVHAVSPEVAVEVIGEYYGVLDPFDRSRSPQHGVRQGSRL